MKLKGDEYLQLQKVFHSLSKNTIYEQLNWKNIDNDTNLQDAYASQLIEHIPEELVDMKDYAQQLLLNFKFGVLFSLQIGERLRSQCGQDRKKAYQLLTSIAGDMSTDDGYKFKDAIMKCYISSEVNESIRLSVHRALKP